MKKLFFSILLMLGLFTVNQAQTLTWNIQNQSNYDWDWKMGDNSGNAVFYNLPGPSAPVTGAFLGYGGTLYFGGQNIPLGCNASGIINPSPGTSIPFVCSSVNVINYSLTIVPIWPFINYHLHLEIS